MEKKDEQHLQMNELQTADEREITEKSPLKSDADGNDGFETKKNGKEKKDNHRQRDGSSCLSSLKVKLLVILLVGLIASALIVAYLFYLHTETMNLPDDSEIVGYLSLIPSTKGTNESSTNTNLIYYNQDDNETWTKYANGMSDFLSAYHINITKEANSNVTICKPGALPEEGKVCYWDISEIERLCNSSDNFGYPAGNPCVFIKFDGYENFTAEPYTTDMADENSTLPIKVVDNRLEVDGDNITNYRLNETFTYLHCVGSSPADKENVQGVQYAPKSQEFARNSLANIDNQSYLPPFIALKLNKVQQKVVVGFTCKLLAKNMIYADKSPFQIQFNVLIQ